MSGTYFLIQFHVFEFCFKFVDVQVIKISGVLGLVCATTEWMMS